MGKSRKARNAGYDQATIGKRTSCGQYRGNVRSGRKNRQGNPEEGERNNKNPPTAVREKGQCRALLLTRKGRKGS